MSAQLPAAYEEYCELQTSEHSLQQSIGAIHRLALLFSSEFPVDMSSYESLNDQLYSIWQRYVGKTLPENHRVFSTTGSTRNGRRQYKFGPHPDLWIQAMWELTRMPLGWRTIVKFDSHMNHNAHLTVTADPVGLYQQLISCGPLGDQPTRDLIAILRQLLSEYEAISLISVPDSFLYLNRHPVFQEFIIQNSARINLMSQHWEPFYPRAELRDCGVHFNDTLGDWTTGLFFYTCRDGFRHCYPTFATSGKERINLLNLMPTPELGPGTEEDLVEPISVSACSCGRNRLDFRFIPHQATAMRPPAGGILYDLELAEQLTSRFLSLQFIQENETLIIRYRVEGGMRDRELLEDYFRPHGYQIQWQPNDIYAVGTKRPVFYRYPG
ncbi:MAG: hypothetical protein R3C17_21880 [Planctomycetaceae bacterium]